MDSATRRARLRWRCRRGMKELDQLLLVYLDRCWEQADEAQRACFERLLDVEDDRLWRWMLGREPAGDSQLAGLLERILAAAGPADPV